MTMRDNVVKTFHQLNEQKNKDAASVSDNASIDAVSTATALTFAEKLRQKEQLKEAVTNSQTPAPTAPAASQPKALFQPTVQAAVDDNSRQLLEAAIARLALDDYQFLDTELSRANLLQTAIKIDDPSYVTDYGAEASQQSENILNQLTTVTRSDYADGVRKYLNLILIDTQKVNLDAIRAATNPSFFDRLFSKGVTNKAGFIELERSIKNHCALCQDRLNHLKKTQQIFAELFQKNEQQFRSLTVYLLAGQLRLEAEQQRLAQQETQSQNIFAQQAVLDQKDALARFGRRLHTLTVLRHTVLLRIGQLRLEQKNTLTLIDQANETINLVIPAWRQQILALFSLTANDDHDALYQQLAATQDTLSKKLVSLD